MKIIVMLACCSLVYSCHQTSKEKEKQSAVEITEPIEFFPVTAYLKGQLAEIRSRGITPLKYTLIGDHTDSAWLKPEELNTACMEFLQPKIDTTNLVPLFFEKKFLDQTIAAYTFTYDPIGTLPDSINLKHWDVYINPETGKVKRIYMVKKMGANKILQLTWLSDKWCKITTIIELPDGQSAVEKEEKITWDFDQL